MNTCRARFGGPALSRTGRGLSRTTPRTGVEQWAHPEVGQLRLAYETLEFAAPNEQRLVIYLASDEATAAALDRLTDQNPAVSSTVAG